MSQNHDDLDIDITEKQRDSLINSAYATALDILSGCDKLAEGEFKSPLEMFCTGLYTHAIEEYGKILWLKNLPVSEGKIRIDHQKYSSHQTKYNMIDHDTGFPDVCKKIYNAPEDGKIVYGKFSSSASDTDATPLTRFQIFYSDYHKTGDPIPYPKIDKEVLKTAIGTFTGFIFDSRQKWEANLKH